MFGNSKDFITPGQLADQLGPLLKRMDELEQRVTSLEERLGGEEDSAPAARDFAERGDGQAPSSFQPEAAAPTPPVADDGACETWYLNAPSVDGRFSEASREVQEGKSIYQLRTKDGQSGHFVMLGTADALATATISVSQLVKPVCRIEGSARRQPREVVTLEEGEAELKDGLWQMTRRAVVKFL